MVPTTASNANANALSLSRKFISQFRFKKKKNSDCLNQNLDYIPYVSKMINFTYIYKNILNFSYIYIL